MMQNPQTPPSLQTPRSPFLGALFLALAIASNACATADREKTTKPTDEESARGSSQANTPPSALTSAHQSWLTGDWIGVGEHVREVLVDPNASTLVKQNAYELLDKAYEATNGKLPAAFVLPPSIRHVTYGNIRGMSPHGPYARIFVRGRLKDASQVKGVTVRQGAIGDSLGEVLLDKATRVGEYKIKHDEPGFEDFNIEAKVTALPPDGVLTLRIELVDGTTSEGWFIAHALASSTSLEIKSPLASAFIADPNPVVSWVPFRSPEHAAFEGRNLSIYVSRDPDDALAWDFWKNEPGDLGEVRIGAHSEGTTTRLTPGDYWLAMFAGESRQFGPVVMVRSSQTIRPFHVVAR